MKMELPFCYMGTYDKFHVTYDIFRAKRVNHFIKWVHMTNFMLHMTYLMGMIEKRMDKYACI